MIKEVPQLVGKDSVLRDSDTDQTLPIEKAIDVTEEFKNLGSGERALLCYMSAVRGRIVQISEPYPGEEYFGSGVHFFLDELSNKDESWLHRAKVGGFDPNRLFALAVLNAPDKKE